MIEAPALTLLLLSFSDWRIALPFGVLFGLLTVIFLVLRKARQNRTATPSEKFPVWDSSKPWDSLAELFAATLQHGQAAIGWYRINIRNKRAGSQIIRLLAILLFSVGALIPLVINIARVEGKSNELFDAQWGYISFAVATGLLAADKFYGFSTGWARYIKTQLVLERGLSDLRYEWVALASKVPCQQPTPDQIQAMIQKLKEFVDFAHTQIEQETEAWVVEFQTSLSDLTTSLKTQTEAARPGTVEVKVTNADKFEKVRALLDQMSELPLQGNQCVFPSVAPGVHAVTVRGTKDGKEFTGADVVKVTAGVLASVSISIPIPSV